MRPSQLLSFALLLTAAPAAAGEERPLSLPGEKEFASCLRLKPDQRFRLTVEKQNIIIALTPHVIEGPNDLARVLESKLQERREFLRHFGTPEERRLASAGTTTGMLERINQAVKEVEQRDLERELAAEPAATEPVPL